MAGTARARWYFPFVAVCWAETLPVTASKAGRALGPILPASAWECWPFCVLRDSCHAALPHQPGLLPIGSGRRTGGSRHHPYPFIPAANIHCIDAGGAGPCCVDVSQSTRQSPAQTAHLHAFPKMWLSRALRVLLCAFRRRAERPGRSGSCRYVWLTWERRLVRACAKLCYVYAAALGSCRKRVEREVLRDTGRHGWAPRLARLPRGISRVSD
eukprot:COSAG02_NODE_4544_length_5228_cov_8.569117_6_plen_213_part_00